MDINLVLLKKDSPHKIFPLPSSITVIGRRHSCDLCIPLISVSKKHCQLNHDGEVLKIRDLDSSNGTYLNGKRVDKEAVVQAGNSIKIGPLTFVLQIDGKPQMIVKPDSAVKSPSPQDATTEDITDKLLDSSAELEGLD
jgi:pSer/pThr/pTyr-binding forkhead associated (FHA) protein